MVEVMGFPGVKLDEAIAGSGTGSDEGSEFKLGTIVTLDDGGEAIYVHAGEAIAVSDFVAIDENFEAALITAALVLVGHGIGVAADVALADNEFGWVRTKGSNFSGNVLASCAADIALYTSGTAGKLDDATGGTRVDGVVAVTAGSSGGVSAVEIIAANGIHVEAI
jgi:hypothetical protein